MHFFIPEVECVPPVTPDNGMDLTCSDRYYYGSVCTFKCKSGFILPKIGVDMIICTADKTWSGIFTACEGMSLSIIKLE